MHGQLRRAITALLTLAIGLSIQISSSAQAQQPRPRTIAERLLQRGQIINITDDLLAFWEGAKSQPPARQRRLFKRAVESRYHDYFERAVYRGADPNQREAILDEFLVRVPERIDAIREFNRKLNNPAASPLINALVDFKIWFRGFKAGGDIYIGPSLFRFDGAIRPVGNEGGIPDTLCLGVEVLAGYSPEQVRVTVAHELFHLYHFNYLFDHPSVEDFRTAHMPLMIEGMAVAATQQLYPNLSEELYLHFSTDQLVLQQQVFRQSATHYLQLMLSGAPPESYEPWFSGHHADVPLRGGYLLGREVVNRMLAYYTLDQMIRMTPAELRIHSEEQLASIAGVRVMLVAGNE